MVTFQEDTLPEEPRKCDCSACNICRFFCREPQFILKVLLIVVNIIIAMTIIAGNTVKLRSTVHATHTSLKVNQSLFYPSVTICQHPALRYNNTTKKKVVNNVLLNKRSSKLGNDHYSIKSPNLTRKFFSKR